MLLDLLRPLGGPLREVPSHQAAPDMSGAGGKAKPSGAGPRGKVVDADYTETR